MTRGIRASETQKAENLKTVVIYSALGLGTATALFFLARHFFKKVQANQSQKSSLDEGDPATYAKQLKMAFENDNYFGWGTNEEQVFRILNDIPSQGMYVKVQRAYKNMYGTNLNDDLSNEMSAEEYNELIRIKNAKKQ